MNLPKVPLADPGDFYGLAGVSHLAAAGETPLLTAQGAIFNRFMADKADGMSGRERIFENVEYARRSVATLLGANVEEVGFPLNVAQGMNLVARTLGNATGNVVMPQWEYPSAMYPWMTGTGLEVRLVPDERYQMDPERFARYVDNDTRAIVFSLTSYFTGERMDLVTYRKIADRHGAMLIVDMSHTFGAAPFDVTLTDFAFGCGYKWALGTHGAGIGYCNAARQPGWIPADSGWTSIEWVDAGVRDKNATSVDDGRRFELGNPAALCVHILGAGVDYLIAHRPEAIEAHLLALTGELRSQLVELGLKVLTPADAARRLGIVAFTIDDEAAWRKGLEARNVLGWVGDKRVRLSPHLYNKADDVAAAVAAVADIQGERERSDCRV
jgi:selenocysteine lyase/cysteine desulfurase